MDQQRLCRRRDAIAQRSGSLVQPIVSGHSPGSTKRLLGPTLMLRPGASTISRLPRPVETSLPSASASPIVADSQAAAVGRQMARFAGPLDDAPAGGLRRGGAAQRTWSRTRTAQPSRASAASGRLLAGTSRFAMGLGSSPGQVGGRPW